MSKIIYIFKRIKRMSFSSMLDSVKLVSKRSEKSVFFIFLDMVWCGLRYQAGYTDYVVFEMENTNARQRKTIITRGVSNRIVNRFNDSSYCHIFYNKDEFNTMFADFLGREWIRLENKESFKEWLSGKEILISKPRDGVGGQGVEKFKVSDFKNSDELFDYLKSSGVEIVEQCLKQHSEMDKLYDGSVNTVRAITLNKGGNITILCTPIRIGNGGIVDNFNSGGLITRADVNTGIVMFDAADKAGNAYEKHPKTGTRFIGFQIPMWEQCMDLVKKAAAVVPQIGYVGWDIAITPDGPVLIEGNEFPGHDMCQIPPNAQDRTGLLPRFKSVINS
ncbi:MAG TPA: sugar-transfer associated ATP-grasp domain-containing protein [Clostridia bacterium]|nr:sugar-transfer associated ATP-grasp domain-containing protein [Clostridia bacterium]